MWCLDSGWERCCRKSWGGAGGKPIQDTNTLATGPHASQDISSPFGPWNVHSVDLALFLRWLLWQLLGWPSLAGCPVGFGVPQGSVLAHLPFARSSIKDLVCARH